MLTASSTQDIGIAFSRKQKTFIHVIDEHIDNERSKIVNDLVFTGCVESLDMVPTAVGAARCVQLHRRPAADGWQRGSVAYQ